MGKALAWPLPHAFHLEGEGELMLPVKLFTYQTESHHLVHGPIVFHPMKVTSWTIQARETISSEIR